MADDSRIVGKHTLETLTTGMYADNRIIFREYIQNSADAIDKAVAEGILASQDEGRIDITINREHRQIRIRDNGTGIRSEQVYHILGDVGKSQKNYAENRGFRGIGRLGGLGYCNELQFITSYKGEHKKTITIWDCNELKRLLQPSIEKDLSLIDVINSVTIQDNTQPEDQEKHYFEVILSGINEGHNSLLDEDDIQDYLSQVAPVPFNYQDSSLLQKINQKFEELKIESEEFKIWLNNQQIYKPYKSYVFIGEKDEKKDFIKDIQFFECRKDDNSLFFLGWYGTRDNYSIMIKDETVNGLRIRKRNILIGNNRTADSFFGNNTNARFNRNFIGEIYVFDDDLLPNGRRDDFEKNPVYFHFKTEIEKTTKGILAVLPRNAQQVRSSDKALQQVPQKIETYQKELENGVTESRKEQIRKDIQELKKQTNRINPTAYTKIQTDPACPADSKEIHTEKAKEAEIEKKNLLDQLNLLEEKTQATKKRLTDGLSPIDKPTRKTIERIFNVIDRMLEEGLAKEVKAQIIEEFKQKSKETK